MGIGRNRGVKQGFPQLGGNTTAVSRAAQVTGFGRSAHSVVMLIENTDATLFQPNGLP